MRLPTEKRQEYLAYAISNLVQEMRHFSRSPELDSALGFLQSLQRDPDEPGRSPPLYQVVSTRDLQTLRAKAGGWDSVVALGQAPAIDLEKVRRDTEAALSGKAVAG